jgi:hypothetical protein
MRLITRTIPVVIAVVLLWAAVDKILHYEGFVNALRNYILVPRGWAPFLATPVTLIELFVGLGLLRPRWRSSAALAAAAMFTVFTAALMFNHAFGARGICGCWFTLTLAQGTATHIAQNVMLMMLAMSVWWDSRSGALAQPERGKSFGDRLAPSGAQSGK